MHNSEYPVSIDLAIHPKAVMEGFPAPAPAAKGKKAKPIYPSLYLNNIEGLDEFPREGTALVHFKRRSVTKSENDEGSNHSVDLEICEICLPEKSSDEEKGDMADAMKGMAKERGLNVGENDEEESPEEDASETEADEEAEGMEPEDTTDEDEEK
jgi:hypothetical protein